MEQQFTAQRLSGFGTSVFTEMSRLAVEHRAINLGQGFPDFPGPDFVKEAAIAAIQADHNQYAPSHGTARLRQAIASTFSRSYGREIDPDTEVTVTSGATEALQAAMLAFINPGDEVLYFEPFYDAYPVYASMAGAMPRFVTLRPPEFGLDLDELAGAVNDRTRLIVVNNPHNPTGRVLTREEVEGIAAICLERDLIALTDDAYEEMIYEGEMHRLARVDGM